MKSIFKISLVVALLLAVMTPAAMAQGQLRVKVEVIDAETKEPIPGVEMVAYQPERPNNRWTDTSNADGEIVITGMQPGRVTFEMVKDGYQNGKFTQRLPSNRARINFTIELAPIIRAEGEVTPEIVEEYNRGMALAKEGKPEEALKVFQQMIEEYPDVKELYAAAATQYNTLEQYDKALETLMKMHEMDTENVDTMLRIAEAYSAMGETEKANNWFKKILEKDPTDLYAIEKIAFSSYEAGNYEDAVKYYEKALEIQPDNPIANFYLGNIFYVQDNYEKALKHYQNYVDLDPENNTGGVPDAKMIIEDIKKRLEASQQ